MLKSIKTFFDKLAPVAEQTESEKLHALQLAVSVLLVEMSRMDGEVNEQEEKYIHGLLDQFDLSTEEKTEITVLANSKLNDATDYYQFTSIINGHFDQSQKIAMIEQLWQVAFSDGKLDAHEEHFLRKIHSLLHVSHRDFIRTKHRAKNNSEDTL